MAIFTIAQGRGLRLVTRRGELDVAPIEIVNDLGAAPVTVDGRPIGTFGEPRDINDFNGSRIVIDVEGRVRVAGIEIDQIRFAIDGRDAETRALDNSGRILFKVSDIVSANSIPEIFPINQNSDIIRGAELTDQISGGRGNDRVIGKGGNDRLKGDSGNDLVVGGSGNDNIAGNSGSDTLRGGGGDDTMKGGGGSDTIKGAAGNDNINGGGKGDLIVGGAGDDLLRGAGGQDTFQFRSNDGDDTILDFKTDVDLIQIKSGARNFAQLEISDTADGALVEFGRTTIELRNIDAGSLDSDDFIF